MKTILALALIGLAAAGAAGAADAPPVPRPDAADNPQSPETEAPDSARRGPRGNRPIERWLELMRQREPEQVAELERLRVEDPEAFGEALRARLAEMRERHAAESPAGRDPARARGVPPIRPRRVDPADAPPAPTDRRRREPDPARERLRDLEGRLRDLGARYAASADPAERTRIRAAVGELLAESFALRQDLHRRHLDRLEAEIVRLRAAIDENEARREEILGERQIRLLGDDGNGAAPPAP